MTLAEIAAVVDGVVDGDTQVTVTAEAFVDSRSPVAGGLFVAVPGERVDGHDYAAQALAGGAAAMLGVRSAGVPGVLVPDPVVALGRLARHVLDVLSPSVVALTGSQGKTGTKDYLGQVLATAGPTVATAANNNNELGVPLTVLRADADTTYVVVEMGARGIGHIGHLCQIAPPRVAAVINVGTAHVGEFGSRAAIAVAKGEILEALPADGVAVLNADDPLVAAMTDRTAATCVTFGATGDISWRGVELDLLGRPSFEIGYAGEWRHVRLSQPGAHQIANAAAAAALALALGLSLEQVAQALTAATAGSRWRMELHERADGLVVVNDAYNANPASMAAAVEALVAIGSAGARRTVAVLGVMLELGDESADAHVELGRLAAASGVDVVLAVGHDAEGIARGARDTAGWAGEALVTVGRDEALAWVRENVAAPDVVLVKASRGAALEKIADGLLEEE